MRFSRHTLNIIIIGCLVTISWIHLDKVDPEREPLEALKQPPLTDAGWHNWPSREGPSNYWQQIRDTKGTVRILMNSNPVEFALPQSDWVTELRQQTQQLSKYSAIHAVLLQGPWPESDIQAISAYLIKQLGLVTVEHNVIGLGFCEQQFPAGSLWFRDHWSEPVSDLDKALPTRAQWQGYRQQQTQRLRNKWFSHTGQLDIQTDIAYHRPPADYYRTLYRALGSSQKTAPSDYLACKQGISSER